MYYAEFTFLYDFDVNIKVTDGDRNFTTKEIK